MSLPTLTNQSVGSIPLPKGALITTGTYTAFKTVKTNGTATTCNLATDTFIYRADGGIWDDTCSCWIPVEATVLDATARNQDGI